MLFKALELIRLSLNHFLATNGNQEDAVILGNIAYALGDDPGTQNTDESARIYMTLVNVEEEQTFRTQPAVRRPETGSLANPPVHLNLYILFTANHKQYPQALQALSKVVLFFQSNRIFSVSDTPPPSEGEFATIDEEENQMRIILEIVNLSFEQINHLWGSLGGKQAPFILYKARKVEIDAARTLRGGGIIQEIQIQSS